MANYSLPTSNINSPFYMREINRRMENGGFCTYTGYPDYFLCDYKTPICHYCQKGYSIEDMQYIYIQNESYKGINIHGKEYANTYCNVMLDEYGVSVNDSICKYCYNFKALKKYAERKLQRELKIKAIEQPIDLKYCEMVILATHLVLKNQINPKYIRL